MINRGVNLLSIMAIPIVFSCINNPSENDTIIPDVGRVIKGRMVGSDGKPVSGAAIQIFPSDFVPSLSKSAAMSDDTTDENGRYQIPIADSGVFNLEGLHDTLGVFIDSIIIPHDSEDVVVPDAIFKRLGVIKGISYMPGQNDTNQVRVTLYIPGTRKITKPVIGGKFSFNNVAEGRYQIIIDPTLDEYTVKIIDTAIHAGDTLDLDTVRLDKHEPDTIDIVTSAVWGNWGPNKIYRINGDVEIPKGQTLSIDSGTTIIISGCFLIKGLINSQIVARGTENAPITFTYPFAGNPSGFIVTEGYVSVSYCIFEKLDQALCVIGTQSLSTIHNCVFRYCIDGLVASRADSVMVHNCIFHDNHSSLQTYWVSKDSLYVTNYLNNIFYNNKYGIRIDLVYSISSKKSFSFNCFHNNDSTIICMLYDSSANENYRVPYDISSDTSIVTKDPLFTSTAAMKEDYTLQSTSPCIGTGINKTDMGIYSSYKP